MEKFDSKRIESKIKASKIQKTLLVVEDVEAIRLMIGMLLRKLGYRIMQAASGIEALEICSDEMDRPQMLLTDIEMPDMTGIELAEKMKQIHPNLKIAFMSAYSAEELEDKGMDLKGCPLINKPFTPSDLQNTVVEIIER